MWPSPQLCADPDLTMRLAGAEPSPLGLRFDAAGTAGFDTAFNLFPAGKWRALCGIDSLFLALEGEGRFAVTLEALDPEGDQIPPGLQRRRLLEQEVTLPVVLDLSPHRAAGVALSFSLRALSPGRLRQARWQTRDIPRRRPDLVLSITTFRREAAISDTVARFLQHMRSAEPPLHLIVVDNGQSAELPRSPHLTLVPNRNLGGSGGFARGLSLARARGASHVIFMDDDAFIDMQALDRVWAFLAYCRDEATAVFGGLAQAADPTRLWESGAVFHQICRPRYQDLDLTSAAEAVMMEAEVHGPPPQTYGGFWFFAFPLASVQHWPFPFFVRGDDIGFSLSNRFRLTSLPGVVSFQDQDFADKESALMVYLELRNHLIQHLALPHMALGARDLAFIPAIFFARSLLQHHMDSLQALNLALEDVLAGPAGFAKAVDLAERRSDIAALRHYEVWQPITGPLPRPRQRIDPASAGLRRLMKLSLNGLLLPFFGLWGDHLVLARNQRGKVRAVWGAARITYVDEKAGVCMTVRQRKLRALTLGLRSGWNLMRLMAGRQRLQAQWTRGFADLTRPEFWEAEFFRKD